MTKVPNIRWFWAERGEIIVVRYTAENHQYLDVPVYMFCHEKSLSMPGDLCMWDDKTAPCIEKPTLKRSFSVELNGIMLFSGFLRNGELIGMN